MNLAKEINRYKKVVEYLSRNHKNVNETYGPHFYVKKFQVCVYQEISIELFLHQQNDGDQFLGDLRIFDHRKRSGASLYSTRDRIRASLPEEQIEEIFGKKFTDLISEELGFDIGYKHRRSTNMFYCFDQIPYPIVLQLLELLDRQTNFIDEAFEKELPWHKRRFRKLRKER